MKPLKLFHSINELRDERDAALRIIMRCRENGWAILSDKLEVVNTFPQRLSALAEVLRFRYFRNRLTRNRPAPVRVGVKFLGPETLSRRQAG